MAAATLVLASNGDVFALAVLLGIAASSPISGAAACLAAVAFLARWGTTSLTTVAGAQAVLGPAISVGPPSGAASSSAAAIAVLLAAPPGATILIFGPAAALLAAGPAVVGLPEFAVRFGAALVATAGAAAATRWIPRAIARGGAVAAGAAAVALGIAT